MKAVEADRNLPVLPYPKVPVQRVFHQLQHLQHSFRTRLGRRPGFLPSK